MEESRKKTIMIGVIVVCLALAVVITLQLREKAGGVAGIKRGVKIWTKCRNPNCEAEYQMEKRDYAEYVQTHMDPILMTVPALICEKCGEESIYRAIECKECGLVFERYSVPESLPDKCPKCGFSEMERIREKARAKAKVAGDE